jgi:hypothetical protein
MRGDAECRGLRRDKRCINMLEELGARDIALES